MSSDDKKPLSAKEFERLTAEKLKKYDALAKQAAQASAPAASRPSAPQARQIVLTPASAFKMEATLWLWDGWLPMGALSLLAGREGTGKSTIAYDRASRLSRGTLPGDKFGVPMGTVVCATEDSWSHTILPRLVAHDADLDRIFHVGVHVAEGDFDGALILPVDLGELEDAIVKNNIGLVILDPLLSRLAEGLSTHIDAEVRKALEPLSAMADRTGANVLGLIHVNKGSGKDANTTIMGSRAFAAVARTVLFVVTHPEDATTRVLTLSKNNLSAVDVPGYTYQIHSAKVGHDEKAGKDIITGKIEWTGITDESADELIRAAEDKKQPAAGVVGAAGEWLYAYLVMKDGAVESQQVKTDGAMAGHPEHALKRALAKDPRLASERLGGFPAKTLWAIVVPSAEGPE